MPDFIRDAQIGDELAVAGVHVRSWQVGYRGLIADEYLNALSPAELAGRYSFALTDERSPRTRLFVRDGHVLGFATFGPNPEGTPATGELMALYVEPSQWDHGVGRELMDDARQQMATRRYVSAGLWVLAGNHRASRFYQRDGWVFDGIERVEQRGTVATTEHHMIASLVDVTSA